MPAEGAAGGAGGGSGSSRWVSKVFQLFGDDVVPPRRGARGAPTALSVALHRGDERDRPAVLATAIAVVFEPARPTTTLATGPAESEGGRSSRHRRPRPARRERRLRPPFGARPAVRRERPERAAGGAVPAGHRGRPGTRVHHRAVGPGPVPGVAGAGLAAGHALGYHWSGQTTTSPWAPRRRPAGIPSHRSMRRRRGRRAAAISWWSSRRAAAFSRLGGRRWLSRGSSPCGRELRDEIRLLSGISGGSVGIAFYLDSVPGTRRRRMPPGEVDQQQPGRNRVRIRVPRFLPAAHRGVLPLDLDRGSAGAPVAQDRQWHGQRRRDQRCRTVY